MFNCLRGAPKTEQPGGEGRYPQSPARRRFMWMQTKSPAPNNVVVKFDNADVGRRLRAEIAAVNPENLNRFEAVAAAQLDINYKALGTIRLKSEAGKLNMNMQDIRRYASGVINNTVRLKEIERLKKLVGESRQILGSIGIRGEEFKEAFADIVHYGSLVHRTQLSSSEIAKQAALIDYEKFRTRMLARGVDQEQLNKLVMNAQEYAGVKSGIEALAKQMGVDIGTIDGLEAFPKILTPELVQRISSRELDESLFEQVLQGHVPFSDLLRNDNLAKYAPGVATDVMAQRLNKMWEQSAYRQLEPGTLGKLKEQEAARIRELRQTFKREIDDLKRYEKQAKASSKTAQGFDQKAVLDRLKARREALKESQAKRVTEVRESFKRQRSGLVENVRTVTPEKLNELVDNPLEFRKFLKRNVSPQQLDRLVEEGIFTALPLSSTEMLDYFRDIYRLPGTTKLRDVLELDPIRALDEYSQRLARQAANSELFNYVRTEGVREGWAITKSMMEDIANGRLRIPDVDVKDFVRLGDIDWKKLGVDPDRIKVADFYMHKDAAGIFKAVMFTSANPYMMSNLAGAIMKVSSYLRLSILGGQLWKFANRVTLGNIFQLLHASNLNPASLAVWTRNFIDVSRALSGKGLNAFDDTKPFIEVGGRTYTRRAAMAELMNYRSSDAVPLTPGEIIRGSSSAGKNTLENARDFALRLMSPVTGIHRAAMFAQYAAKPGKMEPVKFAANFGRYYWRHGIIEGLEGLMAPLGGFANMTDVVTRMAMMDMWRSRKFDSFQDIASLTDEYIPSPDSGGAFTKTWGSLVQPFSRYAMWNLPAAIRHATANPHSFVAYHKILQFLNRSTSSVCNTREAEVRDYQLDGYPLMIGCDGKDRIMINIANFEGQADAISYLDKTARDLAGLFGYYTGTSAEKRQQFLEKGGIAKAVRTQLGKSYYAGIAEYLVGEDFETGMKLDDDKVVSWNGIEMSPRLRALVASAFPALDILNRENPGGVFGRAQVSDAYGNVIRPEQLPMFGARRTDKDLKYDDSVAKNKVLSVLRNFGGLNLQVANEALSLQYNDADMQRSIQESKKRITTLRNKLVEDYDKLSRDEIARRSSKIEELAEATALIEFDYARLQAYMIDKDVLPAEALTKLKEIQRTDNSMQMLNDGVPYPELKVQARILEDYYNAVKQVEK